MQIDWDSEDTHVLLNPRIPQGDRERYISQLLERGLLGHIWVTTSGTSGRFKFVALSKGAVLCSAKAVNDHLGSGPADVWLHSLPDFHVGGLGIWARANLSGAKVVKFTDKWEPRSFCKAAHESAATLTALVPTQVFDLVRAGLAAPPSLRATIVGGGALASALYREAQQLGWHPLPSYGLTECASQVATASPGQYGEAKVLPHVQVKIIEEGTIAIKSPALLTLYGEEGRFYDPKVDGWFITEDRGGLSGDTLQVWGRSADFVKIGGESVNFAHLQSTLDEVKFSLSIPEEGILRAVPDARLGHVVHLCVAGSQTPEIERLIDAYNERVMPYESIRAIRYVASIPRTSTGKLLR